MIMRFFMCWLKSPFFYTWLVTIDACIEDYQLLEFLVAFWLLFVWHFSRTSLLFAVCWYTAWYWNSVELYESIQTTTYHLLFADILLDITYCFSYKLSWYHNFCSLFCLCMYMYICARPNASLSGRKYVFSQPNKNSGLEKTKTTVCLTQMKAHPLLHKFIGFLNPEAKDLF